MVTARNFLEVRRRRLRFRLCSAPARRTPCCLLPQPSLAWNMRCTCIGSPCASLALPPRPGRRHPNPDPASSRVRARSSRPLPQVYRYQSWGGQDALPVFQRGQAFQPAAIELKQVGSQRDPLFSHRLAQAGNRPSLGPPGSAQLAAGWLRGAAGWNAGRREQG